MRASKNCRANSFCRSRVQFRIAQMHHQTDAISDLKSLLRESGASLCSLHFFWKRALAAVARAALRTDRTQVHRDRQFVHCACSCCSVAVVVVVGGVVVVAVVVAVVCWWWRDVVFCCIVVVVVLLLLRFQCCSSGCLFLFFIFLLFPIPTTSLIYSVYIGIFCEMCTFRSFSIISLISQ